MGNIGWDEWEGFNNMCGIYDGKNGGVRGCVGRGMGEVMGYYKDGKELLEDIGEYSKKWYGRDVGVGGMRKRDGVYDWEKMLGLYSSGEGSYWESEGNGVGKLM